VYAAQALRLKLGVPHGQDLVYQQHVWLEVRGDREPQPHVHPRGIPLHRRVDERLHSGEVYDARQLGGDLAPVHAENRPAQHHVLAACQLRVKTGADLDESGKPAVDHDPPLCGRRDTRQQLQQCALARTVPADDPE